jgi:hypothetical protein
VLEPSLVAAVGADDRPVLAALKFGRPSSIRLRLIEVDKDFAEVEPAQVPNPSGRRLKMRSPSSTDSGWWT